MRTEIRLNRNLYPLSNYSYKLSNLFIVSTYVRFKRRIHHIRISLDCLLITLVKIKSNKGCQASSNTSNDSSFAQRVSKVLLDLIFFVILRFHLFAVRYQS